MWKSAFWHFGGFWAEVLLVKLLWGNARHLWAPAAEPAQVWGGGVHMWAELSPDRLLSWDEGMSADILPVKSLLLPKSKGLKDESAAEFLQMSDCSAQQIFSFQTVFSRIRCLFNFVGKKEHWSTMKVKPTLHIFYVNASFVKRVIDARTEALIVQEKDSVSFNKTFSF